MMPNRYSEAHLQPKGAGDGRPSALQVVQNECLVGKLSHMTFLITGTSSGIGVETARALAATGARLFLTVRDLAKGEEVLHDILSPGRVELIHMDLLSLASVREGAVEILSKAGGRLNVLICNAGIMQVPTHEITSDGFESQFATNHLAHFLLFQLVKDALVSSSTADFDSRVVMVSSSAHRNGSVQFDNYNLNDIYTPTLAYAQSKTANIWTANQIERVYGNSGLHALSVYPGRVKTQLLNNIPEDKMQWYLSQPEIAAAFKSPEQGAATTVYGAVSKDFEGRGGIYLENCCESEPVKEVHTVADLGYAKWAFDAEAEKRLWEDSLKMVGLA